MAEDRQQPVAESQPDQNTKRYRSKGENFFDFMVYGPGNFAGVFAMSAILAVLQKRYFPFIHEKLEDGLRKIHTPRPIVEASSPILLTSWGGTLMLPILKWAEDNKTHWVQKFNGWFGDKVSDESIEKAPKQTWGSLIGGRIATIALILPSMSVIGGMFGPKMGAAEEKAGHAVAQWMQVPTHANLPAGIMEEQARLAEAVKHAPTPELNSELTRVSRIIEKHETVPFTFGKMLAVDTVVTAAAVATLYVTSHIFAARNKQKQELRAQETPQPRIAAATASTPEQLAAAPALLTQQP